MNVEYTLTGTHEGPKSGHKFTDADFAEFARSTFRRHRIQGARRSEFKLTVNVAYDDGEKVTKTFDDEVQS